MIIEAFKMDYGECLLIEGNKSCLLVDCGSESSEKDLYFERVHKCLEAKRNAGKTIDAMISHFHNDHVNGFLKIFHDNAKVNPKSDEKEREAKIDFDRVFIPNIFYKGNNNHPNAVDRYLVSYILERITWPNSKENKLVPRPLSILEVLRMLVKNDKRIILFGEGSKYPDDWKTKSDYSIQGFWPAPKGFAPIRNWDRIMHATKLYIESNRSQLEAISDAISDAYLSLAWQRSSNSEENNGSRDNQDLKDDPRRIDKSNGLSNSTNLQPKHTYSVDDIDAIKNELEEMIDHLCDVDQNLKNYISNQVYLLRRKANETSIVCTVTSCADGGTPQKILLTGDITNSILRNETSIMNCDYHFDVVKAQHHGTGTHYIKKNPIKTKYLLVSNGITKLKRGKMYKEYCPVIVSEDYSLVCTMYKKEIAERCTESNCNECVNCKEIVKGIKEEYDSVAINLDTQQVYSRRYR